MLNDLLGRRSGVKQSDPAKMKRHGSLLRGIPKIRVLHDDKPHQKTPDQLASAKYMYYPSRVVFLYRDPRDVMVSLYFHRTKRGQINLSSIDEFVRKDEGALASLVEYYNIWLRQSALLPYVRMVSYEDLLSDTCLTLCSIAHFLKIPEITPSEVRSVVEEWSFTKMQQKEKRLEVDTDKVRPRNPDDPESFKTRRGKAGGYTDYMEQALISEINEYLDKHLAPFYADQYLT